MEKRYNGDHGNFILKKTKMSSKFSVAMIFILSFSAVSRISYASNSKYLYIKTTLSDRQYMCHYKEMPEEFDVSELIASSTKIPLDPALSCQWNIIQSGSAVSSYIIYKSENKGTWYITSFDYDHNHHVSIKLDDLLVLRPYKSDAQKFILTPTGFPMHPQGLYLKSSVNDSVAYYVKDLEFDSDFAIGYLEKELHEQDIYKAIFFMES